MIVKNKKVKFSIRSFVLLISLFQLSLILMIFSGKYESEVLIFRGFIGFILLSFIPGFIILRILRVNNVGYIETLLYSVGLSISFLMMMGIFINFFYPILGNHKPISIFPILINLTVLITILSIVYYKFKRTTHFNINLNLNYLLSPYTLILILIPFSTLFGVYIYNVYNNNSIILLIILFISFFPILIVLKKLPFNLNPLIIFIASISLLFQTVLISNHLWGWDIHYEYYFANKVIAQSYWDYNLSYTLESLPLITLIAPIYSIITGLNLVWVFKIIFPLFFSLVPLGIYHISKNQFKDELISVLGSFVFIFYYGFYKDMPDKQHIAELFLILLIMVLIDKKIPNFSKKLIALIFSSSIILSHYGTAVIFLLFLLFSLLFKFIFQKNIKSNSLFSPVFCAYFSILAISWFIYISGGINFNYVIQIATYAMKDFVNIYSAPISRSGQDYASLEMPTFTWLIFKYIHLILQLFIALGIAKLLISIINKRNKFSNFDFFALPIFFYGLIIVQIFSPTGMGMDRIIQITLTFLGVFAVIGSNFIFEFLDKMFMNKKFLVLEFKRYNLSMIFFGIYLSIFLLFNSGFMFEVTHDPYPMLLTQNKSTAYSVYDYKEVRGAEWLKTNAETNRIFTAGNQLKTRREGLLLSEFFLYSNMEEFNFNVNTTKIESPAYIFLGRFTVEEGIIFDKKIFGFNKEKINIIETKFYNKVLYKTNKIYDNGASNIYNV